MNTFKKFIAILIAVFTRFSFWGCTGEFTQALGGGTHGGGGGGTVEQPELDSDPTNDFTVTLKADGNPYTPRMDMYARWSDGFSVHTAPIDKNGVAGKPVYGVGKMEIPEGGFVVSGHGKASEWVLENIKKGRTVTFNGKILKVM